MYQDLAYAYIFNLAAGITDDTDVGDAQPAASQERQTANSATMKGDC